MTAAVLEVYEEQLKENPSDYHVWLSRANEYYRQDEYLRALNDVDNALRHIPAKEVADREMALMLRANIYIQTERPEDALNDLNALVDFDRNNFAAIYLRANTLYSLERYDDAGTDYQRLLRLNSRSPEAVVGLARVAMKGNNLGRADELLEQAVALDPNNSDLYVRRATVRRDMGNDSGAVDDLILALAVNSKNSRAMSLLMEYGDINYAVTVNGLTEAIRQAPAVGMYLYLRAVIAQRHYHYKAALEDYRTILDNNLYSYQGLWRSMAECRYAMGEFERALDDVDNALAMDRNAGDAALLRAKILRALGRYNEAKRQAASAVFMMPDNVAAINEMGLIYTDMKDYGQAYDLFAETTANAGDTPEGQWCNLLRGWVLGSFMNKPDEATQAYNMVARLAAMDPDSRLAQIYGAFGELFAAHRAKGIAAIEAVLTANSTHPYINYMGACFFAQIDDFDTALEYVRKALEGGYANYYDWEYNNDALVNVAPLRTDLRFLNLLDRYKHLR